MTALLRKLLRRLKGELLFLHLVAVIKPKRALLAVIGPTTTWV